MKLKKLLDNKGYSQAEAARMSGLSVRTIQDAIKRGDCRVSTAVKLAKALGVSLDELCADSEEEQ